MMILSLVTDELSSDLETAVEIGNEMGIEHFELRGIESFRVGNLPSHLEDFCVQLINDCRFQFRPIAISPGIFKDPLITSQIPENFSVLRWQYRDEHELRERNKNLYSQHLERLLPQSISFAGKIGVSKIIIFGIGRERTNGDKSNTDLVVDLLREAARIADKAGVTLLLENEHICYADTARTTSKLLERVGAVNLMVNWDLANSACAGEIPYPNGYEWIRDRLGHVHFKDVITEGPHSFRYVVDGEIDWKGQIRALIRDGYKGFISIETHCRPKVKAVRDSVKLLEEMMRC